MNDHVRRNIINSPEQRTRIVLQGSRWVEAGANLPAVQNRRQVVAPRQARQVQVSHQSDNGYIFGDQHKMFVGLKLVETDEQASRFYSTYYPNVGMPVEYEIDRVYTEPVQPNHGGGYYLFATDNPLQFMNAIHQGLVTNDINHPGQWYAILRCEGYGPYIAYDKYGKTIPFGQWNQTKKLACSQLIPVEVVGHWQA